MKDKTLLPNRQNVLHPSYEGQSSSFKPAKCLSYSSLDKENKFSIKTASIYGKVHRTNYTGGF